MKAKLFIFSTSNIKLIIFTGINYFSTIFRQIAFIFLWFKDNFLFSDVKALYPHAQNILPDRARDWRHFHTAPPQIITKLCPYTTHIFQKIYCEVISKRILIILTQEEAEIFKDYFFILARYSVRLPLFSYDLKIFFFSDVKALYTLPFLEKKSFFPFIVFFTF
jgi:hypothetical protein